MTYPAADFGGVCCCSSCWVAFDGQRAFLGLGGVFGACGRGSQTGLVLRPAGRAVKHGMVSKATARPAGPNRPTNRPVARPTNRSGQQKRTPPFPPPPQNEKPLQQLMAPSPAPRPRPVPALHKQKRHTHTHTKRNPKSAGGRHPHRRPRPARRGPRFRRRRRRAALHGALPAAPPARAARGEA